MAAYMKVYKMFRINKSGELLPLYVQAKRVMPLGKWLLAEVGELVDATHVKASGCGGKLSLRPGFHSARIPVATWIGKRDEDGTLIQRKDTVWCECLVRGKQLYVKERYGLRTLPDGWYYYKTNSKQEEPWIISKEMKIIRVLSDAEVDEICRGFGVEPQRREKVA